MARTSIDSKNLPPKSKFMMSYIKELGEMLDKVDKRLNLVQKDTQSVNAKVEALSIGKEERFKIAYMHESEGSYGGDNLSESNGGMRRSSRSSMGKRHERDVRMKRNRREERRERHGRRGGEPREEELHMSKCKIPQFLQYCKLVEYVDWKLMVDQIVSSFDLHDCKVVRLVTVEFCGYALIWWNQVLEEIRSDKKGHYEGRKVLRKGVKLPLAERNSPISTPMPPRASSIKCFKCLGKGHITSQCPNRSVMIVKDDGEIGSESSIGEVDTSSESESLNDGSHYEGDLLVVRRLMNSHVGEKVETQRENIFHSRSLILGNLCSMIIDGGSCVNVASERLVKKLALPTIVHQRPEKGELLVDRQVEVMFTLGGYEDRVVGSYTKKLKGYIVI
ncbi:hypothetical protein CR513_44313, partial [Mucuna pruriens]